MGRLRDCFASTGALGAALFLFTACDVAFTEPAPGAAGVRVDLEPYVGLWSSPDVGASSVLLVTPLSGNLLRAEILDASEPYSTADAAAAATAAYTVALTAAGGMQIAWFALDQDATVGSGGRAPWPDRTVWWAAALERDGDGWAMLPLDSGAVRDAVAKGLVPAEMVAELPTEEYEGMILLLDPAGADPFAGVADPAGLFDAGEAIRFVPLDAAWWARVMPRPEGPRGPTPGQAASAYPFPVSEPPHGYAPPTPMAAPTAPTPTAIPVAAEPDRPVPIERLLVGLVVVLVTGAVAGFAVNYVRSRGRPPSALPATEATIAAAPVPERDASWRYVWPAIVILAVVGGPILYLAILLRGLALPLWSAGAPGGTAMLLHDFAPYALVISFGAVIGMAEVIGAYAAFPVAALRSRWAAALVSFNAGGTLLAYSVAVAYASGPDHPLLRTLAAAIGFALVIRTRFVIARDLDDPSGRRGIHLDLGWPYARLQALAHRGITRDLMHDRRFAAHAVLQRCSDRGALERWAVEAVRISARDRADGLQAELREVAATATSDTVARARLAAFIVDVTDHEGLLALLDLMELEAQSTA